MNTYPVGKVICNHIDTCLPDYFGGHHLTYIAVAVDGSTTTAELLQAMHNEVSQGAFGGRNAVPALTEREDFLSECHKAIDRIGTYRKDRGIFEDRVFPDLDKRSDDDCTDSVQAYFTFAPEY